MIRILSIDPGHTTGVAVYDEDGILELSTAIPYKTIYKVGFLRDLLHLVQPKIVLLEGIPQSHVDITTSDLWYYLKAWLASFNYEVIHIQPSQWKGFVKRVEIPGQHARDAASMAKWFLENKEKEYAR